MTADLAIFAFGVVVGAVVAGFVVGGQYLGFVIAAARRKSGGQ